MKIDRRRLLRGSLAAPLVLTVRPASATAITSATACLERCDEKAKLIRPPKLTSSMQSDNWMRVELDEYKLAPAINTTPYNGRYFLGHDAITYWRLDDRDPYVVAAQMTNYTKGSCYAEKTGKRFYALAYIDEQVQVKGYAWENKWQHSPATLSCYTSAAGIKPKY